MSASTVHESTESTSVTVTNRRRELSPVNSINTQVMSVMVSGLAQSAAVVVAATAGAGGALHPVRWSESISVPSTEPFRRSSSVCRQYVDGKWTDDRQQVSVDVRRCDGVRFESRLSTLRPVGFTESIICFVGRGGAGHYRSTAEYAAGPATPLLRPCSFFETCYILPPESRKSLTAAFGEAIEANSRSQAAGRWYSASMQLQPNSSAADMNNNANIVGGGGPAAGRRQERSSPTSATTSVSNHPSARYRTRLVVGVN